MELKEFHSAYVKALGKKTYVRTVNGDFPAVLSGFDFMTRSVTFTLRDGTKEVSVDDIGSIDLFQPMDKDRLLPIILASFNKTVTFELAGSAVKGVVVGVTNERVDVQTADSVESLSLQSISAALPEEPIEVIKVRPAPDAAKAQPEQDAQPEKAEEPAPEVVAPEEKTEEPSAEIETPEAKGPEAEPVAEIKAEPETEKEPAPEAPAQEIEEKEEKEPEPAAEAVKPEPVRPAAVAAKSAQIPRYGRIDPAAYRASLLERKASDAEAEPEKEGPAAVEAEAAAEAPAVVEEIPETVETEFIEETPAVVESAVIEEAPADADPEVTEESPETVEAEVIEEVPATDEPEVIEDTPATEEPVAIEKAPAETEPEVAEEVPETVEAEVVEETPEVAEAEPAAAEAEEVAAPVEKAAEFPAAVAEAGTPADDAVEDAGADMKLMSGPHVKKAFLDRIKEDSESKAEFDFSILENAFAGKDPKQRREYRTENVQGVEPEEHKAGFFGSLFKKRHGEPENGSGEEQKAPVADGTGELTQEDVDDLSTAILQHPEDRTCADALLGRCLSVPLEIKLSLAYRYATGKGDLLSVMKIAADRGVDDFKAYSAADILAAPEAGFNPYKALQNIAGLVSSGYFSDGKNGDLASSLIGSLLGGDFIPVKNQESMHINIAAALAAVCSLEETAVRLIGDDVLSRSAYAACVLASGLMRRGDDDGARKLLSVFEDGDGAPSGVRLLKAVLSGDAPEGCRDYFIGFFLDSDCDSWDGFVNACDKAVVRAELSGDGARAFDMFVRMSGVVPDSIPVRRQIIRLARYAADGVERDLALFDALSALCSGLPAGTETSVSLRKLIYLLYIVKYKNYPEVPERVAGLLSAPYDSLAGLYSDIIDAQSGNMLRVIAEDCERISSDGSVPEGIYLSLSYAFVLGDWNEYLRFAAGIGFVPDEYQKKMIPFRAGAFIRSLINAYIGDPDRAGYYADQAEYLFGSSADALKSFDPGEDAAGRIVALTAVSFESRNTFDIVKRLALNDEKLEAALIKVVSLFCRLCRAYNIRVNIEFENELLQDIGSCAIVRWSDELFAMSGEKIRADYLIKCATYVFRGKNYVESLDLGMKASEALAGQQFPKKVYRKLRSQIEALVFSCGLQLGSALCLGYAEELPIANLINVFSWTVMNCTGDDILSVSRKFDGERAVIFRTVLYASSGRWTHARAVIASMDDGDAKDAADDYLFRAACYVKYLLDNKIRTSQRNFQNSGLISEIAGDASKSRGDFFYICGSANRSVEDLEL